MAKKKYTTEYFLPELRRMLKTYDTTYYMIYGQREDGKSYAVKTIIKESIEQGYNFAYIRRRHSMIVRKNMIKLFGDMQNEFMKDMGTEIYYDSQRGFYIADEAGNDKIVGYVSSLEDVFNAKSIPWVNIKYILFDEFIDYEYMANEISMFLHCMSTICRPPNENVKIFMLGNTIAKHCPYFKLFGFEPNKIKQGECYFIKHNLGVSAVIQHTPTKVDDINTKKKTNNYIGFDDNESVNMIMFGEWEYNHCQTKFIDGIGWNCMRHFIPIYLTALNQCYEFTINTDISVPILFVRKVNIQMGRCKPKVKYNLSFDNTVQLNTVNGCVPTITSVNNLVDKTTREKWKYVKLCMETSRVIYDTIATGSEVMSYLKLVN